jgi:hypothetical protein
MADFVASSVNWNILSATANSAVANTILPIFTTTDITPPIVLNVLPVGGLVLRSSVVSFEVLDLVRLSAVVIMAYYSPSEFEVVWDSTTFSFNYENSNRSPIINGWRFNLVRRGGWHKSPSIRVLAVDGSGNIS